MVPDEVISLVESLRLYLAERVSPYRELVLDYSWPSCGVLDLLVPHIRREVLLQSGAPNDKIRMIAAYIGEFACSCWRALPGNLTSRYVIDVETGEITLEVSAPSGKEPFFKIDLVSTVRSLLLEPEKLHPTFERQFLPVDARNRLSHFALGLAAGLSRLGTGSWSKRAFYQATGHLIHLQNHLAPGSAAYYRAIFPDEELGASSNLYCATVILPPAGFDEENPGARALEGLIGHLRETGQNEEAMGEFAANFSRMPEHLMGTLGLILRAALSGPQIDFDLFAQLQSRYAELYSLRSLFCIARQAIGKCRDWITALDNGDSAKAAELLQREQQLGFMPPVFCPPEAVFGDQLLPFYRAISDGKLNEALQLGAQIIQKRRTDFDFALQLAELALQLSQMGDTIHYTGMVLADGVCGRASTLVQAHRLMADCSLAQGNLRDALEHAEKGSKILGDKLVDLPLLSETVVEIYRRSNREPEALELIQKTIEAHPNNGRLKILRAEILLQLGKRPEALSSVLQLMHLLPNHLEVCDLLLRLDSARA